MSQPTRIYLWFCVRLSFWLVVLLAPWPGLGEAYSRAAGAVGNALVGICKFDGVLLHFDLPRATAGVADTGFGTELAIRNLATGQALRIPIELRTLTFIPSAAFLALTLASCIWRDRRGPLVLIAGLAVLHVFLSVSLAVPILLFFANPLPMQLLELSTPVQWAMNVFYRSLVAPPGMIYAVPLAVWLSMLWVVPADARRATVGHDGPLAAA